MQCELGLQSVPKIDPLIHLVSQPDHGFPIRLAFRYPTHFNSHARMQMQKVNLHKKIISNK